MKESCGCCKGIEKLTPAATLNLPGLTALSYRVGTHASFLETMKARLSNLELTPEDLGGTGNKGDRLRPLQDLTTRDESDPAIALLDAWALVADVLTFYQERIANEGFLGTAVERLSILELARLIGYRLRPGVAASVFLAYTLEKGTQVEIPLGARAQSLPGPGELPQSFETSDKLEARAEWNTLQLRLTRPQNPAVVLRERRALYFKGIDTKLKPNDPLLIDPGIGAPALLRVMSVIPNQAAAYTKVTVQLWSGETIAPSVSLAVAAGSFSAPPTADSIAELQVMTDRLKRAEGFDVNTGTQTAQRVIAQLGKLENKLESIKSNAELKQVLDAALPSLREEHRLATEGNFTKLLPWIDTILSELEGVAEKLAQTETRAAEAATTITRAATTPPGLNQVSADGRSVNLIAPSLGRLMQVIDDLEKPTSQPPASSKHLSRSIAGSFSIASDAWAKLLVTMRPALREVLYTAWENLSVTAPTTARVYALRTRASVFGHNAPLKPITNTESGRVVGTEEWTLLRVPTEQRNKVSLDASYPEILPGSWAVLEKPFRLGHGTSLPVPPIITKTVRVQETSRADYGITAAGTQLELARNWIEENDGFEVIRGTKVFAQSELLELAEEPIDPEAEPLCGNRIELANLVSGLEAGRWLIVSGERTDIEHELSGLEIAGDLNADDNRPERDADAGALIDTGGDANTEARLRAPRNGDKQVLPGVTSTELVMLGGVEQGYDTRFPGDKTHTTLLLAKGLANCYRRDTVTIYGNVVKATHGETKNEVLGSGDGSQAMQQFALRQSPLTYLPASTPAGAASTLQLRVNDVLWHESYGLVGLGPRDRRYVTRTDDKDETTVVFGNGKYGARLPTAVENVKAVYRTGIGQSGNVKEQKISSAVTKPLGVKSVINPLPATGGADRENRDQARRNAPMAVMALDRLISVQDYEDFARTYAGIAKASSGRLSDGRRQLVHLTIAGSDDIPIATTSDLFSNLRRALRQFGDPFQPIQVAVRKLKLLVISAKVRLLPDYQWEAVEPKIRAGLLDKFSFAQRELGQDALPSEALSVIQAQAGVAYVDLDVFDAVDESASAETLATLGALELKPRVTVDKAKIDKQQVDPSRRILPAQLAYLSPAVPDTLILTELSA